MARFKKFSGGTDISEYEPLGFELNGQEFECYPAIQGAVFLEFMEQLGGEGATSSAGALYGLLKKVMAPSEYERLDALLHDPKVIIDLSLIAEIVHYLVEEYASRPTKQPQPSDSGS